jgi:hypothetical protein
MINDREEIILPAAMSEADSKKIVSSKRFTV